MNILNRLMQFLCITSQNNLQTLLLALTSLGSRSRMPRNVSLPLGIHLHCTDQKPSENTLYPAAAIAPTVSSYKIKQISCLLIG